MADTLDELVAREAIRRMVAAYCDAVGQGDAQAAGALFAADARLRIGDFPELTGREAITDTMARTFATVGFIHLRCDMGLLDVLGDTARARVNVFECNRRPDADRLGLIFGIYEDEYVHLANGWRFASRRYTLRLRTSVPLDKIEEGPPFDPLFAIGA